jgi:hypothetical protein
MRAMKIFIHSEYGTPRDAIFGCEFQFRFVIPSDRAAPGGGCYVRAFPPLEPDLPRDMAHAMQVMFRFGIPDREPPRGQIDGAFIWREGVHTYMTPAEARTLAEQLRSAADEFETDPNDN